MNGVVGLKSAKKPSPVTRTRDTRKPPCYGAPACASPCNGGAPAAPTQSCSGRCSEGIFGGELLSLGFHRPQLAGDFAVPLTVFVIAFFSAMKLYISYRRAAGFVKRISLPDFHNLFPGKGGFFVHFVRFRRTLVRTYGMRRISCMFVLHLKGSHAKGEKRKNN